MSRYIKLPNSVIVDADLIQCIVRQNVNEYVGVLKECQVTLKLDVTDVEILEKFLGVHVLETPPKIVT